MSSRQAGTDSRRGFSFVAVQAVADWRILLAASRVVGFPCKSSPRSGYGMALCRCGQTGPHSGR